MLYTWSCKSTWKTLQNLPSCIELISKHHFVWSIGNSRSYHPSILPSWDILTQSVLSHHNWTSELWDVLLKSFYSLQECSSFLCFLFLAWVVRAWLPYSSISSSFSINQASSYMHSSIGDLPSRTTPLTKLGRPFKVAIYNYASLTLSPIASNWSLRWDILVK